VTHTVCRKTTAQVMRLSRDNAGIYAPYFDELAVIRVTPPGGGTPVVRNYYNYQRTCADPAGPNIALPTSSQCVVAPANAAAIDISAMFGTVCGQFTVQIEIRNGSTPTGWSTAWVVPA